MPVLEADLQQAQDNLSWCNKCVIIYPMWWDPPLPCLKDFSTLMPGFAFKYHAQDPFCDKLLKGRSAELISTCDAPALYIWWQYSNSNTKALKNATRKFCGFNPVKTHRIGRVKYPDQHQRQKKINKIVN